MMRYHVAAVVYVQARFFSTAANILSNYNGGTVSMAAN
jgi:hypothetical protein